MLTATLPDQLEAFLPLGRHRGATHWLLLWLAVVTLLPFYLQRELAEPFTILLRHAALSCGNVPVRARARPFFARVAGRLFRLRGAGGSLQPPAAQARTVPHLQPPVALGPERVVVSLRLAWNLRLALEDTALNGKPTRRI